MLKASAKGNEGQMQQNEVLVQQLGVNGLKSVGGSFAFGSGNYDSLSKTFFLAPKPVARPAQDLLVPAGRLRPESWVPATVATYQTISWDLDNAFDAIEEIVNKFQPGMLNLVEQQLVGPNGGQPLSFKNDFFGPLGDRLTLISDFKKPIKEDSQRTCWASRWRTPRRSRARSTGSSRSRRAAPKKREFQGTTIYDVDMPNMPNPNAAGRSPFKGQISFAVAKDTFFVTTDTTLLEQVLRPGNATLAENADSRLSPRRSRACQRHELRPARTSRPDCSYDLVKSGQYEKAIQQMLGANARGTAAAADAQARQGDPQREAPDFSVSPSTCRWAGAPASWTTMASP